MKQSESIVELAKALAKAQGEMGGAVKGSDNPFFKTKYADLASVIEAIKPAFTANSLSYVQFPISNERGAGVSTRIMHSSGEWLEAEFIIPCKQDAHGIGSAITYARRYGLQSATGVPAEDDDGNHATSENTSQSYSPQQAVTQNNDDLEWFNEEDFESMRDAMQAKIKSGERTGPEIVKNLRTSFKVNKKFAADIEGLADA